MNEIVRKHTHSTVKTLDKPGPGGANHNYMVKNFLPKDADNIFENFISRIKFQKGPMEEANANGLHNEDLLYIVKHRLECFQAGPFACPENKSALDSINLAIRALEYRTKGRRKRGVEGKLVL